LITIKKNGQFVIPDDEIIIGSLGDNLSNSVKFFLEGVTESNLICRMYLQFDNGKVNYFLLDTESVGNDGVTLIWNITESQILKSGIVKLQIKVFGQNNSIVFHSYSTSVLVNDSIEFAEFFSDKTNSEFLQHEEYLNTLVEKETSSKEELEKASEQATEIYNKISSLTVDDIPKKGSSGLVKSGGIYSSLENKWNFAIRPYVSQISEIDDCKDTKTIYSVTIAGGLISNEPLTFVGVLFANNYNNTLLTSVGNIYSRNCLSGTWTEFKKINANYDDTEQIKENALQALSDISDLNKTIDYQYGSFSMSGNSNTPTAKSCEGNYQRVGKFVTLTGKIIFNQWESGVNYAIFNSLPIAPKKNSENAYHSFGNMLMLTSKSITVKALVGFTGETTVASTGNRIFVQPINNSDHFSDGEYMYFTLTYEVA
jgi:hypothetical protein